MIKFDVYDTPQTRSGGEEKFYHVRVAGAKTIDFEEVLEGMSHPSTVTSTDIVAVLDGLSHFLIRTLKDGNRIHIKGLGYFSVSITTPKTDNPKTITKKKVSVKGIDFLPEKGLVKKLKGTANFERIEEKNHSQDFSEIEIQGILTEYFKDHRSINRSTFQRICGLTRSTALRRLKTYTSASYPILINEGVKNAPVYVPAKGYFGRSFNE
ncbi:MAG: HU family DNA-binding protein [Bacteroidaceae bacterium]